MLPVTGNRVPCNGAISEEISRDGAVTQARVTKGNHLLVLAIKPCLYGDCKFGLPLGSVVAWGGIRGFRVGVGFRGVGY